MEICKCWVPIQSQLNVHLNLLNILNCWNLIPEFNSNIQTNWPYHPLFNLPDDWSHNRAIYILSQHLRSTLEQFSSRSIRLDPICWRSFCMFWIDFLIKIKPVYWLLLQNLVYCSHSYLLTFHRRMQKLPSSNNRNYIVHSYVFTIFSLFMFDYFGV